MWSVTAINPAGPTHKSLPAPRLSKVEILGPMRKPLRIYLVVRLARMQAHFGQLWLISLQRSVSRRKMAPLSQVEVGQNLFGAIYPARSTITAKLFGFRPNSDDLYIERGHVYTVMKNFDAAIGDLTMAIRLNPRTSRAFDERGLAYFKKGDLDRSLKDYTAAITIFQAPEYYASRGHVYEINGDKLKAIDDLRHALLADPSLVAVRDALKRLGAEQPIAIETERRIRDGMALAEAKCANCHATGATGVSPNKDAPEFRNIYRRHAMFALRLPITQGVNAIHDQMPQFKLSVGEIDAIAAYINSLSKAGDN